MTPKLAYFIGYFIADGGLKDIYRSYKISNQFEYKMIVGDEFLIQAEIIKNLFKSLFRLEPPIRTEGIKKGENYFYINPTNKIIYRFLTQVFDMPCGTKTDKIKIPKLILSSNKEIQKWFIRGVFDADGDTRATEFIKDKLSTSRIKLRMRSRVFIKQIKKLLTNIFKISVNGPYHNKRDKCWYIQVERKDCIKSLQKENIFIHPIKRWRLERYVNLKWGDYEGW